MLYIFPAQIRSVAQTHNLESASRDQAEHPGSCKASLLFREAQEWIFAAPDYKDVSVGKKSARWRRSPRSPRIHDQHAIAETGNDTDVVGDEDHRRAEFALHLPNQLRNLRLHRHVERSCRFIRD